MDKPCAQVALHIRGTVAGTSGAKFVNSCPLMKLMFSESINARVYSIT